MLLVLLDFLQISQKLTLELLTQVVLLIFLQDLVGIIDGHVGYQIVSAGLIDFLSCHH